MLKKKRSQKQSFFPAKIFPKSQSGQITIFIIMAIVIVASVTLFFVFRKDIQKVGVSEDVDVNGFLTICLSDKIHEGLELIALQGGSVNNPLNKRFKFTDEKNYVNISFLCYNKNYYSPCINQEPMLIRHIKNELKTYISEDVENCFDGLVLSLKNKGYEAEKTYNGFDVDFTSTKIITEINGKLELTKAEETSKYDNFEVAVLSKFYELALVAQEIVSQEARFCNFEYLGYMLLYPQFKIDKFRTSDSIIIYTVEHKNGIEKFRFAIRGCVMPPGL